MPVIASVNGVCVGAGLDMVAHCDMAVASTAARFQVAYVKLEAKTMELALAVEAGPPLGQKLGKLLAYRTQNRDCESALEFSAIALGTTATSEDRAEGQRSFGEKRESKFTGR